MIVPDAKPDIISTIGTSGGSKYYTKKKLLEGKVRVDGNINTYIMYMADDQNDRIRGLSNRFRFLRKRTNAECTGRNGIVN